MTRRLLRNLLRRRVLAVLVLVFAILGGSMIYVQAGKITTTYRTAVVTYGTITFGYPRRPAPKSGWSRSMRRVSPQIRSRPSNVLSRKFGSS